MGRAAVPDVYEDDNFTLEVGRANMLMDGTDLTIIAVGETVWHAKQAGIELAQQGIHARVLDMAWIKPCDREAVLRAARETGRILTVEEHSRCGGLGEMVCGIVSEHPVPVRILAFPDEDLVHGTNVEIFHHYGIDAEGIVKSAKDFLR